MNKYCTLTKTIEKKISTRYGFTKDEWMKGLVK